MRKLLTIITALLICLAQSAAQPPANNEKEYQEWYAWRIRQETIAGVYIPKDLADAFIQLNKLTDESSRAKLKIVDEREAAKKLFFSLGRWMTVNWAFYEGSRFSEYLRKLGIFHPDDMARFVIITYHRNLNRKSLQVKELVLEFQEMRAEEQKKRLEKGTIIHEEKRKKQD